MKPYFTNIEINTFAVVFKYFTDNSVKCIHVFLIIFYVENKTEYEK